MSGAANTSPSDRHEHNVHLHSVDRVGNIFNTASQKQPAGFDECVPSLQRTIKHALDTLLADQKPDGHWIFELEADSTIPAEYILLTHYLGETPDEALEAKIGSYLRRIQNPDGGWPLLHQGEFNMSASVKAYFALKMIGNSPDDEHMVRARSVILSQGGAAASNVFTHILLALYGFIPWRAVPVMPVEIMLLPRWFPFHLSNVSYWARTVVVPLLVIGALKPRACNPKGVTIDELFLAPPDQTGLTPRAPHQSRFWHACFRGIDAILRVLEPHFPKRLRQHAIKRAEAFVRERLNGEHGLGAIFPAMVNTVKMFEVLGVSRTDPAMATARLAIDKLLVVKEHEAYCQPCVSPVWDTSLMCHVLLETGDPAAIVAAQRGLEWLRPLQILDIRGDWISRRPDVRPGGWAFQYANPHYPDVDDTAVVAMAMHRAAEIEGENRFQEPLARATEWIIGMQSKDGGWGAFEPENSKHYLNNIPFSDHGALLDPSTADVSARCLSMLVQLDPSQREQLTHGQIQTPAGRALAYLLADQKPDGSWYGRWGMTYIYGTWSVLCSLNMAGIKHEAPAMRLAADWLISIQNADGGWGEDETSDNLAYHHFDPAESTASQTAWALLGLMAAGVVSHPAVERGIQYLIDHQGNDGLWDEARFTATGFPRAFYLRYHGFSKFFPLWALARYRNLKQQGSSTIGFGM
ncbi:MAG: squalene--hopene cyclase [Burkholderiales bacterium]